MSPAAGNRSGRLVLACIGAIFLLGACEGGVASRPRPDPVTLVNAFPNLTFVQPVDLQSPSDGTNRIFVVEQQGRIRVFDNTSSVQTAATFLDIRGRVLSGGEQGLLGLAFHPDYGSNRYYYVYYSVSGGTRRTRLSRFEADPANPNATAAGSELIMLEINQPFGNHNGGPLQFGPDGKLYVGVGDGGSANDPQNNGQRLMTLLGKILRLDVDLAAPYIPVDNPFKGNTQGYREEIWAYGLRNPWRMSFDPVTGWLWAGDVGQNAREEIDVIWKGRNYGWNIMEANICRPPTTGCDTTGLIQPVWQYAHGSRSGRSVTGGYVYRGGDFPAHEGWYFYADYITGELWRLRWGNSGPATNELVEHTPLSISSFGLDERGELYVCAHQAGKIYKLKQEVD